MRKLSFLLVAMACCSLMNSCKNEAGMSAKTKKNLEVNDAITKAYESGDFSKMADYIAADAVDHAGEHGTVRGLDSIIMEMKRYKQMMPDMKSGNSISVGNDDYVFTRATVSGSMNGRPVSMTSVDVSRFENGKAVEHWIYMDPAQMMEMMMGNAANTPLTDSTTETAGSKK